MNLKLLAVLIILVAVTACSVAPSPLPAPEPTVAPPVLATETPLPMSSIPTETTSAVGAIPTVIPTAIPILPTATAVQIPLTKTPAQMAARPTDVAAVYGQTIRRIQFQPGATDATLSGNLIAGGMDRFVLKASAGQIMTVHASSIQLALLLQISGSDGQPLKTFESNGSYWSGRLPATQDYYIAIASANGTAVSYVLQVTISALPPPTQVNPPASRIVFPPGHTGTTQNGYLSQNGIDRWVLGARAGQVMTVVVTSTEVQMLLSIHGADGNVLKSSGAGTSQWTGVLPATQDYYLSITTPNGSAARYTLVISIPP